MTERAVIVYLLLVSLLSFDVNASRIALEYSESREGTLELILSLNAQDLAIARQAPLGFPLTEIILNKEIRFRERVLAVRALARLNARAVMHRLKPLLQPSTHGKEIALAREVAIALYQLGARATLKFGLSSHDPEVRATAARSGAGGMALCALLKTDPWPIVRSAAAYGLAIHPDAGPCLTQSLKEKDSKVRLAIVTALGEASVHESIPRLRAIVLNNRENTEVRRGAIIALGQLGQKKIALQILKTHLNHGEMVDFAQVSVLSLSMNNAAAEHFIAALKSPAPTVILSAARALLKLNSEAYTSEIKGARSRLTGRFREQLDLFLQPKVNTSSLGKDLIMDAPEDD